MRRDAGMFDVSHMLAIDVQRRGCARISAPCAGQQRGQAARAGTRALFLHAQPRGRRHRRPDRIFLQRGLVPPGGECGQGRQATSPGSMSLAPQRGRGTRNSAAARPRHDRGAGPARARAGVGGAAGDARGRRKRCRPFMARSWATAAGAHRLHRRRRLRADAAGRARGGAVAAADGPRREALRPGRARHAAPGGGNESVGPGHGRERVAAGRGARMDGRSGEHARFHRQVGAARASAKRGNCSGCCSPRRAACCAAISKWLRRKERARSPAARSRRRSRARSRSRAFRWAWRSGAPVQVSVRDRQLAAKVVQPPFVRNGRILVN